MSVRRSIPQGGFYLYVTPFIFQLANSAADAAFSYFWIVGHGDFVASRLTRVVISFVVQLSINTPYMFCSQTQLGLEAKTCLVDPWFGDIYDLLHTCIQCGKSFKFKQIIAHKRPQFATSPRVRVQAHLRHISLCHHMLPLRTLLAARQKRTPICISSNVLSVPIPRPRTCSIDF
jgi:hypothetical protein